MDGVLSSGSEVVVARASSSPVAAYPTSDTGRVSPARTIADPHLAGTVWDPWGVALGPDGSLFVQSFASDATTFVFAPHASGREPPARVFRVQGPDSRGIAVDGRGYEYVAGGEGPAQVAVAAPGAVGLPAQLFDVAPVRTIPTDEAVWHPWPDIVAVAGRDTIAVAVVRSQGDAVEIFRSGPAGGSSPLRTITGTATGLGSCAPTSCDQMSVTDNRAAHELDVAVTAGSATRIESFPVDAAGDVAPACTITGPATGLAGKVVTGIAADPGSGAVFVMAKTGEFDGTGRVEAFAPGSCGDVAPVRTFTDRHDDFADAMGIAVDR